MLPPEKFWISKALKRYFLHFEGRFNHKLLRQTTVLSLSQYLIIQFNKQILGPVCMIPVYRDLGLLINYCYFCSCVYMETGTSRLNGILVEATEIPVKRDKLCPYKRNIPVHGDEVKWNLKRRLTRENLQKRKQKETTFVGMLFMRTKLVYWQIIINFSTLFLMK